MNKELKKLPRQTSVKKNYVFNLCYQILVILTPVITTPYVSTVLGADGIGQYSYTSALIAMVLNIGGLGIAIYASRQVAYIRDNPIKVKEFCNEIFTVRAVLVFPMLVLYLFLLLFSKYHSLFLIQSIEILFSVTNVDWYYTGRERFDATVMRNFILKIISIICIFLFVKTGDDLLVYTFIQSGSLVGGYVLLYLPIRRELNLIKISFLHFREHLVGAMKLFLPQIAGSIYIYCDKIMLGLFTYNISENGFYEQSQKIIKLSSTLISTMSMVMLPRIANSISCKREGEVKIYMEKSILFVFWIGTPIMCGIFSVAANLVPWFFGKSFYKSINVLKILSPIIIFNGIYNALGYQYLLASQKERIMTITIMSGAFANVLLNAILIPDFGAVGAALASLVAEALIAGSQAIYLRDLLQSFNIGLELMKCIISAILMAGIVSIISVHLVPSIWHTVFLVLLGAVIYILLNIVLKTRLCKEIKHVIPKRLK